MHEYSMSRSNSKQAVKRKSLIRKEHENAFQKVVTDLCNELASVNNEVGKLRQQFTSLPKRQTHATSTEERRES